MTRLILAVFLAGASLIAPSAALADQWTDEANRQATMSRMASQDAANDRAQADRSFQAGLASQRSGSSSGGCNQAGSSQKDSQDRAGHADFLQLLVALAARLSYPNGGLL